jgi:hypothetical protein
MLDVRVARDSVYAPADADHRRNVIGAVILDIEQVRVRSQDCRSFGVALEPAPRGENRGGNPALDQKAHQVRVERSAARVKRERNHVLAWNSDRSRR